MSRPPPGLFHKLAYGHNVSVKSDQLAMPWGIRVRRAVHFACSFLSSLTILLRFFAVFMKVGSWSDWARIVLQVL